MSFNYNSTECLSNKVEPFLDAGELEFRERTKQKESDNHHCSRWQARIKIPGEKKPYQMFITYGGAIKNSEQIKRIVSDHIISILSFLVELDKKNDNSAEQPSNVYNEERRLLAGISELKVRSEGVNIRELLIIYLESKLKLKGLKEKLERLPKSKYITSDRLPIAQQNLQTEIQDLENKVARFEKAIIKILKIDIQKRKHIL